MVPNEIRSVVLVVTNRARVQLSVEARVGNLFVYTNSSLALTNCDLYVNTGRHELGGGTYSATTGRIIWSQGAVLVIR